MNYPSYIALIPLLPLISFLLLGFFGRRLPGNSGGIIGVLSLSISAMLSLYTAWQYFFVNGMVDGVYETITPFKYTWLTFSENISIDMGIILDPLSVMMLVVVTFVSLMVHIFSIGYMKGEARFSTYYSYLSLFTFSMLGLVVSTNIFQIYMFWELVGVSSYLLIGYYFEKPSAVAASKKAFIVTRFADLGFLIGILILGLGAGSLDFMTIMERLTGSSSPELTGMITTSFLGVSALTWALTLIFIGGAGKSAMFPLHIWLPDAMEGPTPVSALIHAATMVVAGVYLVARLFPVFANDPVTMDIITWVGATSAIFAAIIACTQTDIKRVLAYSTMSQIGYMMFALGISGINDGNNTGYIGSLFHLFTHAFFKSLLFLGAGAVIHMVHSNDMKDMGGLKKFMPVTHLTFLIACLAIAGIPPFAGFFSKEEILLAAWNSNPAIYWIALITSGITAFYMFRLYFSIFFSKPAAIHDHHGEGTFTMKLPLIILGVLTVVAGFVPFASLVTPSGLPSHSEIHLVFSIAPVSLALTGIIIAYVLYFRENEKPVKIAAAMGGIYRSAYNKFYIDEIYFFITKNILFNLVGRTSAWVDKKLVDGTMNFIGYLTVLTSELTRGMQSGRVQNYAIYFICSILTLTVYFIYFWK
ncbi:MAG: NADH-quinone oxidoreductase subunit L [Bacteroidota bacterium]|nr:NADH-quinone oxidoreductase subunit L [Bacteroidota bacterium]